MEAAIRTVYDREMGVNQAFKEYGVPTTTLKDRIINKILMVLQWEQGHA